MTSGNDRVIVSPVALALRAEKERPISETTPLRDVVPRPLAGSFPRPLPGSLIGRDGELALISEFVDRASSGDDAMLVTGEPGVGKTALLDAAAERATACGFRVLRASGVEFEADVPFAGLHQVLVPLAEDPAL